MLSQYTSFILILLPIPPERGERERGLSEQLCGVSFPAQLNNTTVLKITTITPAGKELWSYQPPNLGFSLPKFGMWILSSYYWTVQFILRWEWCEDFWNRFLVYQALFSFFVMISTLLEISRSWPCIAIPTKYRSKESSPMTIIHRQNSKM